jgi:hypothetical protein
LLPSSLPQQATTGKRTDNKDERALCECRDSYNNITINLPQTSGAGGGGMRRRTGASSRPMAAFSGFYKSPKPPPLVNAHSIAPSHRHGYRNDQQQRYIHSLSPLLLFDQNIAKRPCYGPFKLTPSYHINLICIISLCISSWLPPPTMDAYLAIIVAVGRARF